MHVIIFPSTKAEVAFLSYFRLSFFACQSSYGNLLINEWS